MVKAFLFPHTLKSAQVICNEDMVNPVNFKWNWGEGALPIVDQYTYVGVEILRECSWDAHTARKVGKGKSQLGRMDTTPSDPHFDTWITILRSMYYDE